MTVVGRITVLGGLLLSVAAFAAEPASPWDLSCTTAADCSSTLRDEHCCVGCRRHAANQASVDARDAACRAKPNPSCPQMDCPPADPTVACVKGRCELRSSVLEPPAPGTVPPSQKPAKKK